ncbi:MAG: TonB-dependent receptor [Calditrichota bacterium]
MRNNLRIIFLASVLLLAFVGVVFAQSGRVTGKIEGVVTDAETGDPLIGVNVVLVNTLLGATTDPDGYYLILNIPAGTYEVEYSYLGYTTKRLTDMVVSPDQSTRMNVKLQVEAIQGEVVEVVAEKPIIQRDQTANVVELGAEQIKRKPVTTFVGIIQNQAGAIQTEGGSGGLHIRGGRAGELVYYIDGVNTNDPTNQKRGTTVDLNAIEQMKIITGGFNAEYGEAMSGVVQIVTKSGARDEYQLFLESQSNDFMTGSLYDNGYNKYAGNFGGPVPFSARKFTFFVNAFNENMDIRDPSAFYTIRNNGEDEKGYTFKLQSDIHPKLRLFFSGNYNKNDYFPYNSDAHRHSQGIWYELIPKRGLESYLLSSSLTHMLSTKFFYDLTFSYFNTSSYLHGQGGRNYNDFQIVNTQLPWVFEASETPHRTNPYFDEENYRWQNGLTEEEAWLNYYHGLGYFQYDQEGNINWLTLEQKIDAYNNRFLDTGYWTYNQDSTDIMYQAFDIDGYQRWQRDRDNPDLKKYAYQGDIHYARYPADKFGYFEYGFTPWWSERTTEKYETEGAFQGQLNKYNYLKIGGKINYATLEFTDIQFLNLNPYFDYYKKKPTTGAAYIQDKIEYEDMIINLGLRYDYFHPHSEVIKNLERVEEGYKQATLKEQWSPRFGIAFAVSDKTLMRANYGHFFQVPDLGEIYQSIQADFTSGVPLIGNPDLPPQKQTMYAIALKHRLSPNVSFEINGYYKDIQKLLSTRQETTFWQGRPAQYTIFKIDDFAKVKGFDLTLEKRPSRFFSGTFTYSYTDAKGTGSSSREFYYFYALLGGGELPRKEYPLEFDVTHSFKFDVNLYLPPKWGPSFLGFTPLQNVVSNFYFNFNSGSPYTPEDLRGNPGELGSKRMPSTNRADLRIEKFIPFNPRFRVSIFADVRNLFNTNNVEEVWTTTGKPDDDGRKLPFDESIYAYEAERWGYMTENGEPDAVGFYSDLIDTWKEYVNRPNYYGIPRIIRFGISAQISL